MIPNTRITTQQMSQSYSTYFGKKITPCQGVVWSQYRLPGTFYFLLGFGVICLPRCVFYYHRSLPSCRFYTGFIVPKF